MKNNDVDLFEQDCLKAHNDYRKKHGVNPLTLSKELCKVSQAWADKMASMGKLQHSNTDGKYGENIFYSYSSDPSFSIDGKAAVDSWYSEIKDHIFGQEPTGLGTGHFTQVVWKETKELGVGCTKARDGKIYVVANYYPPGNYIGDFAVNVPPLGGGTTLEKVTEGLKNLVTGSKDSDYKKECLAAHNEYRKQHHVPALKLNEKMCKEAQAWAQNLAVQDKMEHANTEDGENIFSFWSSKPEYTIHGSAPVDKWYSEISIYDFSREPSDLKSGHFTQVVWKGSKELGVGMAKSATNKLYFVARYSPAGNIVSRFRENVFPIDSSCTKPSTECPRQTTETKEKEKELSSSDFAKEALKIHNEYRKKHGVPELQLNWEMCFFAKEWADKLAIDGNLSHRPNCPYGENVFGHRSSDLSHVVSPKDACDKWYSEIEKHDFTKEPSGNLVSGHFTQMIWKDSTEMGIAMAKGKDDGKTFVVANYKPCGNYMGQFIQNVPKPNK